MGDELLKERVRDLEARLEETVHPNHGMVIVGICAHCGKPYPTWAVSSKLTCPACTPATPLKIDGSARTLAKEWAWFVIPSLIGSLLFVGWPEGWYYGAGGGAGFLFGYLSGYGNGRKAPKHA